MTPYMTSKKVHLYGIDAIRFFCALSVCFFHIGFTVWKNPNSGGRLIANYTYPDLLWASYGWIGVEIFFVISGFVIANSASGRDLWGFLRSRALRLYPAVWICASITASVAAALELYSVPNFINRFIRGITLFPFYPWIEGVYWTLGVEMIFYVLIAILVWTRRFNQVNILAGLLAVASLIYGLSGINIGLQWSRVTLLAHGCFFALGIYFWLYTKGRFSWMTLLAFAGCVLEIVKHTTYVSVQNSVAYNYSALTVWLVAMAGILLSWHWRERTPPLSGILRRLGSTTYPLYLVHYTVGTAICAALTDKLPGIIPVVVAIGAVVLLAWIIAEHLEPRLRDFLSGALTAVEAQLRSRRILA